MWRYQTAAMVGITQISGKSDSPVFDKLETFRHSVEYSTHIAIFMYLSDRQFAFFLYPFSGVDYGLHRFQFFWLIFKGIAERYERYSYKSWLKDFMILILIYYIINRLIFGKLQICINLSIKWKFFESFLFLKLIIFVWIFYYIKKFN